MSPTLGAWIDSPRKEVLTPSWWGRFRDHGLSSGAIMVEGAGQGLDYRWDMHDLAHAGVLARQADVELVLTYWLEPSRKYLAEFERTASALLKLSGAAAIDLDQELNWLTSKLEGFSTLDEAAVEAMRVIRGFTHSLDVRIDLTTFPFHAENSARAVLAPKVDRVYPQAYSVVHRKDGTGAPLVVPWGDRLAPGVLQHVAIERAKQIPGANQPGGPEVCCGLALYDQGFAGHGPMESMKVALDTVASYGVKDVRVWSTKWIWGPSANAYAAKFLMSLKG